MKYTKLILLIVALCSLVYASPIFEKRQASSKAPPVTTTKQAPTLPNKEPPVTTSKAPPSPESSVKTVPVTTTKTAPVSYPPKNPETTIELPPKDLLLQQKQLQVLFMKLHQRLLQLRRLQ